jgi:SAM-dependent methyltransferase
VTNQAENAAEQLLRALKPVEACHLCGSSDPADKRILGNRGVATHDAFAGDRSAPWTRADLVRAVECRRCSLIYADPMPVLDQVDLGSLYHTAYFTQAPAEVTPNVARLSMILDRAGLTPSPDLRMLEVGFGRGEVLLAAHAQGLATVGVEISPDLIDALKRQAPIETHLGALPEVDLPEASFDLIYMSQVLEHVLEPRLYLQAIHRLLKPGGTVYLSVPNEHSIYFRFASALKRWRDGSTYHLAPVYTPYHIYGYSRRSLTRLLNQEGFRVTGYDARVEATSTGTSGLRKQVETLIFKTERLLNAGYCMDLVAKKTTP